VTTIGTFFESRRKLGITFWAKFDIGIIHPEQSLDSQYYCTPIFLNINIVEAEKNGITPKLWMGTKIIGRQDEEDITGKVSN